MRYNSKYNWCFPAGAPTILITLRDLFEGAGELQVQARYAGARVEWGAIAVQFYIETRNSLGGYNSKYRKAATCKGLQF